MENGKSRKRRQLSPEEKWEILLEVTSQEISQADAARNSYTRVAPADLSPAPGRASPAACAHVIISDLLTQAPAAPLSRKSPAQEAL
jgi:hypothetical protein